MAIITARLTSLDDEGVAAVAEIVEQLAQPELVLELTDAELAGIERSREDFKAGRTLTSAEARALTTAFLASLSDQD
jgi:hypothetical protein